MLSERDFEKALLRMSKEERAWWKRRGQEAWNDFMLESELERKELQIWTKHKNKLIKDKSCVKCGKAAETMHHPKSRREYDSFEKYVNESDLKPVCHWCHYTVFHGGNPYHMLWSRCKYRNNPEIRTLREYKQKQVIYKQFCGSCSDNKQCLTVPIVSF